MADDAQRQHLLNSFKEVCAVDDASARQFLSHCEFNLERAVQLFFQTGGVLDNTNEGNENVRNWENENNEQLRRRAVGGQRNGNDSSSASSSGSSINGNQRRPNNVVAGRQMSWIEWFMAVATLPINLFVATLQDLLDGLWGLFGGGRVPEVTDPRGDVARFISKYEEQMGQAVQSRLQFSQEPFMETCQRAKRELRALLILIHDERKEESTIFLRDALSSNIVANIITSNNMLVWGISTATPEGQRVARQLRARSSPTLVLMMARDGRMVTTQRLQSMTADRLAANVQVGVSMIDIHLRQLRAQQQRREEDSRIRAEQEQEYREALEKDKKKKEDRERMEREAREKEEAVKRAEEEREECRRIMEEKRDELRSLGCGEGEVEGDAVRVQIRYPSGEKMERKFSVEEAIESLFNAALSHPSCPTLFSLHTSYPRKALPFCPQWYIEWRVRAFPSEEHIPPSLDCAASFRENSLTQSLVIMVQDEAA